MNHWRSQVGVGIAATLLASLLATSLVATALALTITNTNPSVTVPTGVATNVGINVTWSGTASDTPGGPGLTVTLPAGYSWTGLPLFSLSGSATMSMSAPSTVGQTTRWRLAAFSATGTWTLTLSGGQVMAAGRAGTGPVNLKVGNNAPFQIANLTSSATSGSLLPVTISPTSVPADGTSTIQIAFGTPTATCSNYSSFTVATTRGTFTATTLPVTPAIPSGGTTSVTVNCPSGASSVISSVTGDTLTLRAPTTPGTANITVTMAGATTPDSTTLVTFTKTSAGQGNTEREHGKGARKVAFYASTGATTCAAAPVAPSAGDRSFGFAILNTTGHNGLNVTVSLKGATPNAKYAITVYVQPSSNCPTATFTVRTNSKGNGSGHKNVRDLALTSGAMQPQAWVTAVGPTTLVTTAATLPMKAHRHENAQGNQDNPGRGHGKG